MSYLFHDFKLDAFARLDLVLSGNGGESVEVRIGECLKNGRIDPEPGGYRFFAKAVLILRPGTHTYRFPIPEQKGPGPIPNRCPPPPGGEIAPFRYAEVSGAPGSVGFLRSEIHAPFDDSAAMFESGSENLNRIWEFCRYSIKATTAFGMYVDGNRERLPYEADSYVNQLGHFCLDRNYSIAKKTIEHLLEHPTWPTEWRLITPVLVKDYLLYSGDGESVRTWLPELRERLLPELTGPDGLVRGNGQIRDIVDWPENERDGYVFGSVNFVPNCYLYAAWKAMRLLTGDPVCSGHAETVRSSLRAKMLRNGVFADSPETEHASLHSAVFAIASGVAGTEEFPALAELIRTRGTACSVYGAQFLLDACYLADMPEYAFSLMTARGLRSWNNMLEKGATITMEAWDDSIKPNQDWNHAWGASPANVIPRRLCGIRPLSPGFRTFTVDPAPGRDVGSFVSRHPLPDGEILLSWDGKTFSAEFPAGHTAFFHGEPHKESFRAELLREREERLRETCLRENS